MTGPRIQLALAVLCGVVALATMVSTTAAAAGDPRLFATWRAPYGQPRASDALSVPCGQGAGSDTLFLTYTTGKDSRFYIGLEAQLYLRAQQGDTLARFWQLDGEGKSNVAIEFSTDSIPGCLRPFRGGQSIGGSFYDRTSGSGRFRLTQVVPYSQPVAVRDSTMYFLARVIFQRPADREVCRRPLCIEFANAEFGLDSTIASHSAREGNRFASWNSRDGAVCSPFRPSGPEPWRPKTPRSR